MEEFLLKKICFEFILPWQWSQFNKFSFWCWKAVVPVTFGITKGPCTERSFHFSLPSYIHTDEHWMEESYGEEKIAE